MCQIFVSNIFGDVDRIRFPGCERDCRALRDGTFIVDAHARQDLEPGRRRVRYNRTASRRGESGLRSKKLGAVNPAWRT